MNNSGKWPWSSRTELLGRSVRVFSYGLMIVSIAIGLIVLDDARLRAKNQVISSGQEARLLRWQLAEYQKLVTVAKPKFGMIDLRALFQASARNSGISSAVTSIDVLDDLHIQVSLGAVPVSAWLRSVADLQASHLRIDSCRMQALKTPGMVSVTAVFVAPLP